MSATPLRPPRRDLIPVVLALAFVLVLVALVLLVGPVLAGDPMAGT